MAFRLTRACQLAATRASYQGRRANIAVVGAGWWTQGWHLPHLERNPASNIAAIVEPNTVRSTLNPDIEQLPALCERYNCPGFENIDQLIDAGLAEGIDGVVVCSNHQSHYEIGVKALDAGLNVLMEKPMTVDPVEAVKLQQAADSSNLTFMVNTTANWRANSRRAAELVSNGKIGEVQHVNCYMGSPLLWLFDDPENVNWVKPTGSMAGNGFGWGQLSHTLSWVFMVTGLTPCKAFAFMNYSKKTGADVHVAGSILCTNGATISVQGVGSLPGQNPVSSKQIDNKIFGSDGFIQYSGIDNENEDSGSLILRTHDTESEEWPGFQFENYSPEGIGPESLQEFVEVCRGNPGFDGGGAHVGCLTVLAIDAMYKSARDGVAVNIGS